MSGTTRRAQKPTAAQKLLLVGFGLALLAATVAGLELALRLTGVGAPHLFEDPFVGFAPGRDLFVRAADERGPAVYRTAPEKLAFFNEQEFAVDKPADAYRIFALGGSTTAGRPYDATLAFPAWLERYLAAAEPGRAFEVVNAGGISYASYRVALLMRELVRYEPDLFVVYTGHNEFLEERTYSELIHQPEWLKTLRLELNGLHSFTLARHAVRSLGGRKAELPSTLDADVATRLDGWRGLDLYRRDDELRRSIVAHFEYNLRQMTEIAERAGVPIVFVVPVSNLRDFSPFKSEPGAGLPPEARSRFARRLEEGRALLQAGEARAARELLEEAVESDGLHAEAWYLLGRARLALGDFAAARNAFVAAKDLDVAPLRALEEQVELVERVAAEEADGAVTLPDLLGRELEATAGHRILGAEHLLDHVHPTTAVHSLIAEELLGFLAERGVLSPAPSWSEAARREIFDSVLAGLDERYYAQRDLNLAKVLGWAGKVAEAEAPLRRAAAILGDESEVFLNLGIVLLRTGRPEEALPMLERARELDRESPPVWFNLGVALARLGRLPEAVGALETAARLRPDYSEALFNLGSVEHRRGRPREALTALGRAAELRPGTAEIHRAMAAAYRDLGNDEAARQSLARALEIEPDDAASLVEQGVARAREGRLEAAVESLERAASLQPTSAEAHFNLGLVRSRQGDLEAAAAAYAAALAANPDHVRANVNLGILLARGGEPGRALPHFERAAELAPGYADAHFNLGVCLDALGRPAEALAAVTRAAELDPGNERYRQALELLLAAARS